MQTQAVREGDDWLINGTKMFITRARLPGSVWCWRAQQSRAPRSTASPRSSWTPNTPGYSASKKLEKYGCPRVTQVEINLENVRVSDAQRLGEVDQGFLDTMRILDGGRVSIAAMALGWGAARWPWA